MLPNFDPEQKFYATRELLAGGRIFKSGDLFDKTLVTPRKLYLMFQYHHLAYDWMMNKSPASKRGRKKESSSVNGNESVTETNTLKTLKIKMEGASVDITHVADDKDLRDLLNLPHANTAAE